MLLALILVGSYLVGAIPFGYLVARAKGIDIFKVGSGNIGATNVTRALGRGAGLLVLVLDMLKGVIPAVVAYQVLGRQELAFLAGAFAVVGHTLSPFLRFKGGKGIATGMGALIGTSPLVALGAALVFIVLMIITRIVSFSSLIGAILVIPLAIFFRDPPLLIAAYVLVVLFIIYRHRANIKRLREGTEPKLVFGKDNSAATPAESAEQPMGDEV
jgi:acyl phosphate:glycerol-3-phosphate acyltransferase